MGPARVRRRGRLVALVMAVAAAPLASCVGGSGGGYELTAYFERTIGLYEGGDVHVMGMPVGSVRQIEIQGDRVEVRMSIDEDVPLPADVKATVGQNQLIGERSVVLFPPWDAEQAAAGASRASDGDVIPLERTVTPVEPDEGLAAFDELARSIDGEVVDELIAGSAEILEGRGEALGTAIDEAANLTEALAQVDDKLLATAEDLHVLAGSLATREEQLGRLIDTFSEAAGVLAAEREGIRTFLTSMVTLVEQGQEILDLYGDQLPGDVATATALASVLEENVVSVDQLIASFPLLSEGVARAYQPALDGMFLRAHVTPTVEKLLDTLLAPILGGSR